MRNIFIIKRPSGYLNYHGWCYKETWSDVSKYVADSLILNFQSDSFIHLFT